MSTSATADATALSRRMAELITGYQVSAAVGALARLGVADALADGPLTVTALAERVGADADSLRRVLLAIGGVGLFECMPGDEVSLSPLGQLLRSDVPGSARRAAVAATEEWRWRAFGYTTHSLRTGEPGFIPAHDRGLWDYLDTHPEAAEWFNDVMSRISAGNAAALVAAYDFEGVRHLVDVGGGHGELLQAVLQAHPEMRGTLLELPTVAVGAAQRLAGTTVADRCTTVAGDFFAGVPADADAYVLSWVLHDWDDDSAVRILSRCREVMRDGGRVLAIELVVLAPDDAETAATATAARLAREADLEMLVVVGGKERTQAEYARLFARAGLRLSRVLSLEPLPWSVLVADAAQQA